MIKLSTQSSRVYTGNKWTIAYSCELEEYTHNEQTEMGFRILSLFGMIKDYIIVKSTYYDKRGIS